MRNVVLAVFGGACVLGLVLMAAGERHGGTIALWGALLFVAALFERWRYRPPTGDGPWEDTGERFIDPETGREVSVWFDRRTGRRKYVGLQPPETR